MAIFKDDDDVLNILIKNWMPKIILFFRQAWFGLKISPIKTSVNQQIDRRNLWKSSKE